MNRRRASPRRTVEYRVRWRRVDWLPSTRDASRLFETRAAARRFARRITDGMDPRWLGLSAPVVTIERRPVGVWEEWQL